MKRILIAIIIFTCLITPISGYKILYKEQFYRLYHQHLNMYPDDIMENIYYLEESLRADFANPLNAMARIETKQEWEHYRQLFMMHVNLRLTALYLQLGSKFDKRNAFFFNEPWKAANIDSLNKAEEIYNFAYVYWAEARKYSRLAAKSTFIHLDEIQNWEDEQYRIESGELDYADIISEQLTRLRRVRAEFEAMDESTY